MAQDPFQPLQASITAFQALVDTARTTNQAGGVPAANLAIDQLTDALDSLRVTVDALTASLSAATQVSASVGARAMITEPDP